MSETQEGVRGREEGEGHVREAEPGLESHAEDGPDVLLTKLFAGT